jgi:hypothetical protein
MTTNKFEEVRQVGLEVEIQERTVFDRFVWTLGEKFDAEDMYNTLQEVKGDPGGTVITDHRMVEALINIGVINSTSYSWGTSIGNNIDAFLEMLREALRKSKSEEV